MSAFTAEYSQIYQSEQNCRCDNDHDQCSANSIFNFDKTSNGMLKRSRRIRRVCLFIFAKQNININLLSFFYLRILILNEKQQMPVKIIPIVMHFIMVKLYAFMLLKNHQAIYRIKEILFE